MSGMSPDFRDVDPRELRLPPSRSTGADPVKLQRQIARFGASMAGMPPPWVYEAADGVLVVYNGVTRAREWQRWLPIRSFVSKSSGSCGEPTEVVPRLETVCNE